jgi:hypothetical protein
MMEYRLTSKGQGAEIKPTPMGKILEFMKEGHGVVNPSEVEYELSMPDAKPYLDKLVNAGYLSKEEEHRNAGFAL